MRHAADHLIQLLKRLGMVFALLMLLRGGFLAIHHAQFPVPGLADLLQVVLQGARFDAMTLVVANAPLILLFLLPHPWRGHRQVQRAGVVLFVAVNALVLLLCCIDLPFYGFNGKRITRDVLGHAATGWRELPGFLLRYWWAAAAFAAGVWALVAVARRTPLPTLPAGHRPWSELPLTGLALGLFALLGRGGWQYQGLSPAHATDHVPVSLAPLVTNSAFTFGYSLSEPAFTVRRYFDAPELDERLPLAYTLRKDSTDRQWNVVLLVVESLGREYLSTVSGEHAYMPFLDSLSAHALVLTDAYANAERSNKSMCALLAGIPSFTEDAFMNTTYGGNAVDGLGLRLKELGYTTSYLHGGLNGEYKFDSFSKACGFDRYIGRDEFGDDRHYDGHWGVYDEEFLQFAAERIGEQPQPFCSVVFTLSSHDPFPIPARYKGRFPKGPQDIHESLGYVDMALRRFFASSAAAPWYRNTLFVITGDHTYQYNDHPRWYHNPAGRFAVPIMFFAPDGSFAGRDARTAQHLDVVPSILDLCGYQGTVNAFGRSVFKRDRPAMAAQYLGGVYRLIEGDRLLQYDGARVLGLHDLRLDTLFAHDLSLAEPDTVARMLPRLQALIQRHGEALVGNGLRAR